MKTGEVFFSYLTRFYFNFCCTVGNSVVCLQMPLNGNLSVTVNYRTNIIKVPSFVHLVYSYLPALQYNFLFTFNILTF